MADTLHIVCLDAPSPPDYGGVFDLYYKIPALAAGGINILLHYFDYRGNRGAHGLEPYCREIHKYSRSGFLQALKTRMPYIVASRINAELVQRLNADDHPVLLEGIHCTGLIPHLNKNKKLILRLHNDEAVYYSQLAKAETSLLKKIYFKREAGSLHAWQSKLPKNIPTLAVSLTDLEHFKNTYHFTQLRFLPCFLPWQQIQATTGLGTYCLYHGNLTVSENRQAALWLAEFVFKGNEWPLVIAGRGAESLRSMLPAGNNIRLVDHPDDAQLNRLIEEAHIHVLPSMNTTGVKIKLLHVLFKGRFCMTNTAGIMGSGLEAGVVIADTAEEFRQQVAAHMEQQFDTAELAKRNDLLQLYNNQTSAGIINALL